MTTIAAAVLLSIARAAGAVDYDVLSGSARTSKLIRLRLPNGRPMVIQTNNLTPRVWMLPEHEKGHLSAIGKPQHYVASKSRHWHLDQVREFGGQALVKVAVSTTSWPAIKSAFERVGATT